MKVAFCDDEINVVEQLVKLSDAYSVDRNRPIEHTVYNSAFELCNDIEKGTRYDLIFLDIMMPGMDGISAAREIRTYDANVKIIFLSSSPEYGVTSYTVKAYFYQVKPIWKDAFYQLVDQIYEELAHERENCLVWKCKNGIVRFELDQLEYCESLDRSLIFHKTNGKTYESAAKLDDVEKKLCELPAFIRPHRSYVINMNYIEMISYKSIDMSCGISIPVPHGKYEKIKEKYFEYLMNTNRG